MIEPVAEGIWTAAHPHRQPGGVVIPSRMTVVRLPSGGLWVHSPVPLDDALRAEVHALGPVTDLVAPNLMHHLGLASWVAAWPDATVHATPRLRDKLPDQRVDAALSEEPPDGWGGAFEIVAIGGAPDLDEYVFLHRPTATAIVTDLVFHMLEWANLPTAAVLTLMGTKGRFARSRAWGWFTKDAAAVRQSVAKAAAWAPVRVVPCHGAVLDAPDTAAQWKAVLARF